MKKSKKISLLMLVFSMLFSACSPREGLISRTLPATSDKDSMALMSSEVGVQEAEMSDSLMTEAEETLTSSLVDAASVELSSTETDYSLTEETTLLPDNPFYEKVGLISYFYDYFGNELTYVRDITGDEIDDKIYAHQGEEFLTVFVNEEQALELSTRYIDYVSVHYIRINAKNEFLVVDEITDPGNDDHLYLFRYDNQTKRLDYVQDFRTTGAGRFAHQIADIRLSGLELTITGLSQQNAIGGLFYDAKYVFEKNRFMALPEEINNPVGRDGIRDFTCGYDFEFYEAPGSLTKSFLATKGSVVTIEKVFCDVNYMYGYFIQGENAGWICFDNSLPYYGFKETWHYN